MLKINELIRVGIFTSFIIVAGFIKIPLYPVPFTLTFLVVNLISLISDSKICFTSVLLYIVIGLCGVPVFSQGGGLNYLIKPTFGYLIGFLILTLVCGKLKSLNILTDKLYFRNLLLSLINVALVYITGALYAYLLSAFYFNEVLNLNYLITFYILIFIPGDIISLFLSSYLSVRLKRIEK